MSKWVAIGVYFWYHYPTVSIFSEVCFLDFSNLYFIYIWLPLVLLVYFLTRQMRWKNYVLAGFSLFFYAMGQPVYLALLIGLTYVNFGLAGRICPGNRRSVLVPVALNIGVLALFKYLDFLLGIFGISAGDGLLLSAVRWILRGLNAIGFAFAEPDTVLPIGISFYTFSMISYFVDIYREKVEPEKHFKSLLLYVCLFPKLLQGPIVRYEQMRFQLHHRRVAPKTVFDGAARFTIGLAQKVLLADYCARIISELTVMGAHTSFVGAWLSAVMYMFRIYFDFSGCTDMAIGLGAMFGFTFCENFDLPYTARSITDFWRRWHMSLGTFFRDYVYIPLGGNRRGFQRQILNMLAVWGLSGLWHGASWNYVLWGLYFFALLVAEKRFSTELEKIPVPGRHAITLLLLLFGWVLFAHEDFGQLGAALAGMFGFGGFAGAGAGLKLLNSLPLMAACAFGCTALPRKAAEHWHDLCGMGQGDPEELTPWKAAYVISVFFLMVVLLWLCTVSLVGGTSAPSIYGNF